jgi:hypothetical protein
MTEELDEFIKFKNKWDDRKEQIRNNIFADPNLFHKLFGLLCYFWVTICLKFVNYIYKKKGY